MPPRYPLAHSHVKRGMRSRIGLDATYSQIAGMEIREVIQLLLDQPNFKQADLAIAMGVTQSTVSRWVNGSDPGTTNGKRLEALAKERGLLGDEPVSSVYSRTIPIKGIVGLGEQVEWLGGGDSENNLGEVEVPLALPLGCVALECRGDSMTPRVKNGELVIVRLLDGDLSSVLNEEAAIKTVDGRYLLKTVRRGYEPGTFNLQSMGGAVEENVRLEWAAELFMILPKRQWRSLTR